MAIPVQIGVPSRQANTARLTELIQKGFVQQFLPTSNFYRIDTCSRISNDLRNAGTMRLRTEARFKRNIADYISISGPIHLVDGWSFFSRASSACLSGDIETCVHLAYYAELRAAMALLASEGIGVFNNNHFYVENTGLATFYQHATGSPLKMGTHKFVWEVLKDWTVGNAWRLFGDLLNLGGLTFRQWLNHLPSGPSINAVFAQNMQGLAFDIERLEKDHLMRNEVSYRPSGFRGLRSKGITDELTLIHRLWQLSDPDDFLIESQLLINLLRSTFFANHGSHASRLQSRYKSEIRSTISRNGLQEDLWLGRLTQPVQNNQQVFRDAMGKLGSNVEGHHKQVMARAFILLYLANLSCEKLLDDANIGISDWNGWFSGFGADRGIWGANPPDPLDDLWADVSELIDNLGVLIDTPPGGFLDGWTNNAQILHGASKFEKVGLLLLAT